MAQLSDKNFSPFATHKFSNLINTYNRIFWIANSIMMCAFNDVFMIYIKEFSFRKGREILVT